MDTTTDTSRDPQGAGSLPRELRFELLEPVFNDDQLVGRAGLQWPDHQEPLVIRGHRVLWGESVRFVSGSGKECCRAPDRELQIGIYPSCHEIAGSITVEQLRSAMGPDRLRSAASGNFPLDRARIRELAYINLVPSALVGGVRQPSSVR